MRNLLLSGVSGMLVLMLAGCTNVPSTNIQQPMSARAPERAAATTPRNGAIFQAGQGDRPLFEDRRARNVGDILTINIVETTTASEKSSSNAEHSGSMSIATPSITGGAAAQVLQNPYGVSGSSSGKLANKSDSAGNNVFTGTITATVIEVLPNGNLMVSGEKQVAVHQANEYVRFSGVVSPYTITGSNTVQSTQVADAHLEYKGANNIDQAAVMSMLGRVFLSVLPF